MKTFQRHFLTVVLVFAFTLPTLAGEMDCGIAPPPPPAPPLSTTQDGASGQIPTGPGVTTEGELFSEVVWGVVEGVLALL